MATISSPRAHSPANSTRVQSPQVPPSPSYTPTSSVRASLDLPTSARSSSPSGPAAAGTIPTATQRRNRAALRDYYNIKSKSTPQDISRTASNASTATVSSTAAAAATSSLSTINHPDSTSPTSISTTAFDSPSFAAEPYISNLLATADLKTVLKVEATLIAEIRNLDGERKALVYDNYSKLIKATRTIGAMRINMDGGGGGERTVGRGPERGGGGPGRGLSEDGMRDLWARVEGVGRLAEELGRGRGGGGGGGLEEQEERGRRKEQREKRQLVRWVLDGPRRLRKMVQDGQVREAQAESEVVRGLLDGWGGVKGVEETRRACEEALRGQEAEKEEEGDGAG